jgi:putative ATP-dependent endonuclease of the OLD family
MRIKSVRIENYRSIFSETLTFDDLTILVGANGAGKSTFLRAIDQFYSSSPTITADEFFAGDLSKEIVISLTFTDLGDTAKERFAKYVSSDDLVVDMVVTWVNEKPNISYHGSRLQNPDFLPIYEAAKTSKTEARNVYNELRQDEKYSELPSARNYDLVQEALQVWETDHQDECIRMRDDGQFFGFKEVGRGYLFDHTQFLLISAVRDASQDSEEGKGSVITRLMDLVVRNALASREDLTTFQNEAQEQYEEILKPENLTELTTLRGQLGDTLRTFVPNADISLDWQPLDTLNIPMPKAKVGLVEDGYTSKVEMTGHGLQRAFIFTLLQHLAVAQRPADAPEEDAEDSAQPEMPSFLIAIEEPELYQHPNRQRHFSRVLRKLAKGELSGVVSDIQIVCATHSPLFINIAHFDEVRLIRKELPDNGDLPKASKVYHTSCEEIVARMQSICDDPMYSIEKLKTLMPQLMTTFVNEGFFADVAVIVEGETDRCAILEVADILNHDLEGLGIGIVSTGGKDNILIPAVVFENLGISTYLIWDCDQKANNDGLFNLVDHQPVNAKGNPSKSPSEDVIEPHFATFYKTREYTMENEIGGSLFRTLEEQCDNELGSKSLKKPVVVQRMTRLAYENGQCLSSVETIIQHIITMRNQLFLMNES